MSTFPRQQQHLPDVFDGVSYPDILMSSNGSVIASIQGWEDVRRNELLELFRRHVYGQPLPSPTKQSFEVSTTAFLSTRRKIVGIEIVGTHGRCTFPLRVFIPSAYDERQALLLFIDHRDESTDDPDQNTEYFPLRDLLNMGFAVAAFHVNDISPDSPQRFRIGVIDAFHDSDAPLPNDAGKAISAWAWASSRAMDYFETDGELNVANIAIVGHSRGGKAALWAAAQDERFTTIVANSSGCTGVRMARRGRTSTGTAEDVATINERFPYWFADAYQSFNHREHMLPVDQHALLALIAPRKLYIGSAADDDNADPKGELLGLIAASSIYELYGFKHPELMNAAWPPQLNTPYHGDRLNYLFRTGAHDLTLHDWNAITDALLS